MTSEQLIGASAAIRDIRGTIELAAKTDAKLLLSGETGTGKEIIAREVHASGRRRGGPFVVVHCAGIPESLFESELFGHVKGSFTGADRDKQGILEAAHMGTVFLDEIGEMTLRMQSLLLRFLETGELRKVGGDAIKSPVDVRVIAATNRDLSKMIEQRTFREDLYYRLNVIHITVPPLRARREDVPILVDYFLSRFKEAYRSPNTSVSPEAMNAMISYPWPGNVRELKNVLERLVATCAGGLVTFQDLPPELRGDAESAFEITFSQDFPADELKALLTGLADYFRSCGGVGLAMTFEAERVSIGEPVSA